MVKTRSEIEVPETKGSKTREYDEQERAFIVAWRLSGMSLREIGRKFHPPIAPSVVKAIIDKYQENGNVRNKPRSGRPSKLDDETVEKLKKQVTKDGDSRRQPLAEITRSLNVELEKEISTRTVRRGLKKAGLGSHIAVVKPYISEKTLPLE